MTLFLTFMAQLLISTFRLTATKWAAMTMSYTPDLLSMELPATDRVLSQRPLSLSVASVTPVANDKGDNGMILGAVHRSPGICLTAEENPKKPQLVDRLMKGLCDQSSPQMGSRLFYYSNRLASTLMTVL